MKNMGIIITIEYLFRHEIKQHILFSILFKTRNAMHLLIALGSPRKNGNSETLAQSVAEGFATSGGTVSYLRLNELKITPCQACGGCAKSGVCILKDDMSPLYDLIDQADRLLLVSPVYFYALSAQVKLFGDRFQARWSRKYLLKERFRATEGRKGYLLATAATKGVRLFEACELSARYILDAVDMGYGESFLVRGVEGRKDIGKFPEELQRASEYGRKIYENLI